MLLRDERGMNTGGVAISFLNSIWLTIAGSFARKRPVWHEAAGRRRAHSLPHPAEAGFGNLEGNSELDGGEKRAKVSWARDEAGWERSVGLRARAARHWAISKKQRVGGKDKHRTSALGLNSSQIGRRNWLAILYPLSSASIPFIWPPSGLLSPTLPALAC